ncbi:hypothetical protein IKE67_02425 [bacterium]|nr:hypothetical protein [bacterium]
MIKIFKDAFKVSYYNIIIATPLLLFLLIFNIYLVIAKNAVKALPSTILFFVTLFLMVSAFLAGWLNMIKVAVDNHVNNPDYEKHYGSFELLKEFPVGIAEFIRACLGFSILYLLFADIAFISIYHLGMKLIGGVGISFAKFIAATEAPVAMQALIESLTKAQLLKINYWYLLTICSVQIFALFTMFWPIELINSTKNPIKALFKSVKIIFVKPQVILLFIGINILNLVLALLNYVAMFNPIAYFIVTLIFFYFIVYVFILLFLYYEKKIKGNSNSITDSNGQE